jgi:hypothetical protein
MTKILLDWSDSTHWNPRQASGVRPLRPTRVARRRRRPTSPQGLRTISTRGADQPTKRKDPGCLIITAPIVAMSNTTAAAGPLKVSPRKLRIPLRWSTPRARAPTDSESTLTANQHRRTKYQDQK